MSIEIIQGDITTASTDAIVNAANPSLLGGGGVDGAIHRAAGPSLLEACKEIEAVDGIRCPTGEARITEAGNLRSKYVIHTVGPIYDRSSNPSAELQAAYENSLRLAVKNGCGSIAFPAISCGVYGYPAEEAAKVAIKTCQSFLSSRSVDIFFYLFDATMFNTWRRAKAHL